MKMHPYYTEIPLRSFYAMLRSGGLSEVLLALITDPLEAEDFASLLVRDTPDSIRIRLPDRNIVAPISVADFKEMSLTSVAKWRITLAQHVMSFEDAANTMRSLARYDTRLSAWCSIALIRSVMIELRTPLLDPTSRVVEATDGWVRGFVSLDELNVTGDVLDEAYRSTPNTSVNFLSMRVALAALNLVYTARNRSTAFCGNVVKYVSEVMSPNRLSTEPPPPLLEMIADACFTFPL